MPSTTDRTYEPRVYRQQGGDALIIGSSGDLFVQDGGDIIIESGGDLFVQSGGSVSLNSGSSCVIGTNVELASGRYVARTVTTRGTSQVATAIPLGAHCAVTASTTTPEYKLATPAAGADIVVSLTAQTSNVGCTIYSGSTGVAMATSGPNSITLLGQNQVAHFFARSATRWDVLVNSTIAFATKST